MMAVRTKRRDLHIPDPEIKWWQEWEQKLLGKHPDKETARRIGRTVLAVIMECTK